jgi:hypothetical protein
MSTCVRIMIKRGRFVRDVRENFCATPEILLKRRKHQMDLRADVSAAIKN